MMTLGMRTLQPLAGFKPAVLPVRAAMVMTPVVALMPKYWPRLSPVATAPLSQRSPAFSQMAYTPDDGAVSIQMAGQWSATGN